MLYVIYDNLCVGKLLPLIITIYKSRFVLPGEPIVLIYCGNSGARKALSLLFDLFKAFDYIENSHKSNTFIRKDQFSCCVRNMF